MAQSGREEASQLLVVVIVSPAAQRPAAKMMVAVVVASVVMATVMLAVLGEAASRLMSDSQAAQWPAAVVKVVGAAA